jgi:uncharacterized protein YhaN
MKLTHLAVEGCGRFGTPARIDGFGPGVNILAAGNEAGKSTLFRALRTCLFERHSSVNKHINELATGGLSLPVIITVGFAAGGNSYQIRKSFLRGKSASLTCNGVETSRGSEADEEVWRLLGIEQRSTRALDEAAYGVLWVAQGHSLHTPAPSEGARSALNSVIQQEVGTLVGGERARLLLNSVNEELAKYVTKTSQPKSGGPLDAATKQSSRLSDELTAAEERLEALHRKLEDLDVLRREHKAAADPAALTALKDQLEEANRKLVDAEKATAELNRLRMEERQAHDLARAQQEKLKRLQDQAELIDRQRLRLKSITASLLPLEEEHTEASRSQRADITSKQQHDEEWAALDTREAVLQRVEALAQKLERKAELEERLDRLVDYRQRAAATDAALKAVTVDDAAIKALEAIEREDVMIRAARDAGAARLGITTKPGTTVTLNGTSLAGAVEQPVTEPVTIAIGADVTITITPPASAAEAAGAAVAKQREKLTALLQRHAASSAADLRQRHAERIRIENAARDLRAERTALGLKDDAGAEIDRLAALVESMSADAARLLPGGTRPDIAAERAAIAELRSALRAERSSLEARISANTDVLTKLTGSIAGFHGQRAEIDAQLKSACALLPDETREAVIAACHHELQERLEAHRIKLASLDQGLSRAPAAEEVERQRARVDRLSTASDAQRKKADDLREAIAWLTGEVTVSGGEGLGDAVAALRLQHGMALAETERLSERVEVLKLLRLTVDDCYARRREQLNAPLLRHLQPYLADVFPEARIELGEDFEVTALSRGQGEAFNRLSLGTQEQIAVLVRLAMGAMIAERGEDVPVILDDALVFSDDARIEQMFDALSRAGRKQQVIVLTCRARSFASLGGHQLAITQAAP